MTLAAEGWYKDPYGLHEDRWYSVGRPTNLVRDAGVESHAEPPEAAPPHGDLVRSDPGPQAATGSDVHRADEVFDEPPYDNAKARRALLDIFDQTNGA